MMILPFRPIKSLSDTDANTMKAKIRHMPMMVRKPKVKAVKRIGAKMFQKVYFLLRMRLSMRSRARMERKIISVSLVWRPQL